METKQAIGPNQERWLSALESGEYRQCHGRLGIVADGVEHNCCLGVACRVFNLERKVSSNGGVAYDGYTGTIPPHFAHTLGLRTSDGNLGGLLLNDEKFLTSANDSGVNFDGIAAFCRAHPEYVFTEPR